MDVTGLLTASAEYLASTLKPNNWWVKVNSVSKHNPASAIQQGQFSKRDPAMERTHHTHLWIKRDQSSLSQFCDAHILSCA
jgi:hypothetical protein